MLESPTSGLSHRVSATKDSGSARSKRTVKKGGDFVTTEASQTTVYLEQHTFRFLLHHALIPLIMILTGSENSCLRLRNLPNS